MNIVYFDIIQLLLYVAIYQLLIKLIDSGQPECQLLNEAMKTTAYTCYGINIDDAIPFLPSYTYYLEIVGSKQKNLTLTIKRYTPSLNFLNLIDGKLERINVGCLSGLMHLESLSLTSNQLYYLEEDSLKDLPSLQRLQLSYNKFVSFDDFIPALLPLMNLTFLDLSHNDLLESISFQVERVSKNLTIEELDLTKCNLSRADPTAFSYLNIRKLRISENPIDYHCLKNISLGLKHSSVRTLLAQKLSHRSVFNESAIEPLYTSQIEILDIGDNNFNVMPTFSSFFSLKELIIRRNSIFEVQMDNLLRLPNLEHLDLSRNYIKRLIMGNFPQNGSSLRKFDLSYNVRTSDAFIFVLPNYFFQFLTNLSEFSLEGTLRNIITTSTFRGARSLAKLNLGMCSLNQIEDAAFQDMKSLTVLYLDHNQLKYLRSEMFIGLHNLIQLFLGNNSLNFLNSSSFYHLTNLELLELSNNNIVHLFPSHFVHLTKLESIVLAYNSIVPWNVSVIPRNGSLIYMFLRSNKLNIVTPAMIDDFNKLEEVELGENDFDCWDCSAHEFQQWILSTNVSLKNINKPYGKYDCLQPESLRGVSILTAELETEHCVIAEEDKILVLLVSFCTLAVLLGIGIVSFLLRWHFRYCCYLLQLKVKRYQATQYSISYEYDAFVSFDAEDSDWVMAHLLNTMENATLGFKFCLHDRDWTAGNDILEETLEIIQKCKKTILVLSEAYVKNQWCMFEMQMAEHSLFEEKRDSLILIQLKSIETELISTNLRYLITTRTYLIWTEHPVGQKLFWKRLQSAIIRPNVPQMSRIV